MSDFDPHKSLGFQSELTLKAFTRNLAQRLEGTGISPTQFRVLAHLVAHGTRIQSELCEVLSITAPSAVKLIDRMERDGWVAREADERDRRVKKVVLTAQAKKRWDEISVHAQELLDQAYKDIPLKDIDTTIHLLTQIRRNLGMDCC